MKFLYTLLVFTQLFTIYTSSLLPFSKHPREPKESSNEGFFSARSSVSSDVCDCKKDGGRDCSSCSKCGGVGNKLCNLTLPAPKKVINPYKKEIENLVPLKPFGSFCVKCAACLAVASQLEKVIKSTNEECETDKEKQVQLEQELEKKIKDLCEKGFRNYDLRFYKNHSIITNAFKCTTHIESSMDGNWTKKATGIFRDCSNLETHQNITLPNPNQEETCGCSTLDC